MSKRIATFFCLAALAALATGPASATETFHKKDSYKNPAIKAGGSLDLTNMLGHVSVVAANDGVLTVDSDIVAAAANAQDAQALAGKINLEAKASGNTLVLVTHYPLDDITDELRRHAGAHLQRHLRFRRQPACGLRGACAQGRACDGGQQGGPD
jgi:hypothetical protein